MIPFRLPLDIDAAVEQAFSRLIHEPWGRLSENWRPAVDVFETDDAYLIALEVPGVPPEAINVRMEGPNLVISGARDSLQITQSGRAVKLERNQGRFFRKLQLERPVDAQRLEMRSEDGILHLRLPKLHAKPEEPHSRARDG